MRNRLVRHILQEGENAQGAAPAGTAADNGGDPWGAIEAISSTIDFDKVKNSVPEEHKSIFKDINSFRTLTHNFTHLTKMLGDRIKLPDEKTTPEDAHKFYTKLGKPADAKEYDLKFGDVKLDDKISDAIKSSMFNANLSKSQADAVFQAFMKLSTDIDNEAKTAREAKANETKAEFDKALGDKKDEKLALLKAVGDKVPEFNKLIEDGTIANKVEALKIAELLYNVVGENKDSINKSVFTPVDKDTALKELGKDSKFIADLGGRNGVAAKKEAEARYRRITAVE
jgi:hypothetical protein